MLGSGCINRVASDSLHVGKFAICCAKDIAHCISKMASAVVVGAATGTADLQTILDVAKGQPVALDASTAERLKKESPAPKDFKPEAEQATAHAVGQDSLTSLESRAAVFCRLISLASGSTKLRPAVVQSLVDLLNSNGQLDLKYADSDAGTLNQIASSAAKLSASGLSTEERSVLESGQAVTLGLAATATQAAIKAVLTATAVASVTAEALQTQVCFVKQNLARVHLILAVPQ